MKLSAAQRLAMLVIRQTGGAVMANGIITRRNHVTFATLRALQKRGLLIGSLHDEQWHFETVAK